MEAAFFVCLDVPFLCQAEKFAERGAIPPHQDDRQLRIRSQPQMFCLITLSGQSMPPHRLGHLKSENKLVICIVA